MHSRAGAFPSKGEPDEAPSGRAGSEAAEPWRRHLAEIFRERDEAYRRLKEREVELARIQRIGRVGGLEAEFHNNGVYNRRSPEYLMIHGLGPESVNESYEAWVNRIHPEDRERTVRQFRDALRGPGTEYRAEYRIIRPNDGEVRWIGVIAEIERDPAGRARRLVGAHFDITAAKEAETELRHLNETLEQRIRERTQQLQSSEAQMRAIFETSNQYYVLLDLEGAIVYANRTSLAGIGATEADVVGRPFWQSPWFTALEATRRVVRDAFAAALRGEAVRIELLLTLPAGERFFDFAMRPVRDQRDTVSAVLAEAVDVTERRQSEEALRQAQKMEAVGQLTGGVAHDFNNFLTIIRSATDFLRRRDLSPERKRRYVDAISDTVDRASKLTGQLLAFARRQPLKPQVFDVATQVEIIADLIRPLVGGGVEVAVRIADDGCLASADIAQFETALINLAVNARDAMAGEGKVTIAVRRVDAIPRLRTLARRTGDFIAVSVTDTGTGIAPDKLEVIFEPFYTTKEVGKGTGLGLSQAFGFARQSGGDIEVRSAPGQGATFVIYLPLASAAGATFDPAAATPDAAARDRGHSILMVEDNEDIGRFTTELLEDLGYAIRWVGNADDAMAALAEDAFAFDLVFSDVIMPGINGVDLAAAIRDRYPGLPVVLASGYSNVLAENADLGFELVRKPYSVEVLSRTLRRAITENNRKAG